MIKNYYLSSFFWSTLATVLAALVNFVGVPLLLNYFGLDNYGILTLAISTNAYLAMIDIGNSGAIKYFSEWISQKKYNLLYRASQTSISFYIIIAIINILGLIVIAFCGKTWFNLTEEEFSIFQVSLLILAFFAIFNWVSFVFNQLLIAGENIAFTHKINIIKSLLNLLLFGATIFLKLSLNQYFFFFTLLQTIVIVPYYLKLKHLNLLISIRPLFYWKEFSVIFKYSIALFVMGLFQGMAVKSRPLILGIMSPNASTVLGEYRIIEVFPVFIISLCGVIISILLPKSSRFIANEDKQAVEKMAYDGTRLTSILTCIISFPVILNAREILSVYVGSQYVYLAFWMVLWCFTLVLNLYNAPVSSLVLATGKTKPLVYSSAIACILSMIVNVLLCKYFSLGSAVIGYLIYILIQQCFYYFYFNNKVLNLNSLRILKNFLLPTLTALIPYVLFSLFQVDVFNISKSSIVLLGILKGIGYLIIYVCLLHIFQIFRFQDFIHLLIKK